MASALSTPPQNPTNPQSRCEHLSFPVGNSGCPPNPGERLLEPRHQKTSVYLKLSKQTTKRPRSPVMVSITCSPPETQRPVKPRSDPGLQPRRQKPPRGDLGAAESLSSPNSDSRCSRETQLSSGPRHADSSGACGEGPKGGMTEVKSGLPSECEAPRGASQEWTQHVLSGRLAVRPSYGGWPSDITAPRT